MDIVHTLINIIEHTKTCKHTCVVDPSDLGSTDLLPVRLYAVPVRRLHKEVYPISGHAFNETQTETRF